MTRFACGTQVPTFIQFGSWFWGSSGEGFAIQDLMAVRVLCMFVCGLVLSHACVWCCVHVHSSPLFIPQQLTTNPLQALSEFKVALLQGIIGWLIASPFMCAAVFLATWPLFVAILPAPRTKRAGHASATHASHLD